jgi:hypothetical protein
MFAGGGGNVQTQVVDCWCSRPMFYYRYVAFNIIPELYIYKFVNFDIHSSLFNYFVILNV